MSKGKEASQNKYKCFELSYDKKYDILDICVNNRWQEEKKKGKDCFVYGDESPDEVVTFFYEDTGEVEGYKIFNFMKKLKTNTWQEGEGKND